jgi:hypothetical protein
VDLGGPHKGAKFVSLTYYFTDLFIFMDVGLLKFYEEDTTLKDKIEFFYQIIHYWDAIKHAFKVGPNMWYYAIEGGHAISLRFFVVLNGNNISPGF